MATHPEKIALEALFQDTAFRTRRHFLRQCAMGLGGLALGTLLDACSRAPAPAHSQLEDPFAPRPPRFVPKAQRVIYLHMAGSPSQLELFDYKPDLQKLDGLDCPPSLLEGKRFAFIQGVPKMLGPQAQFARYGESQAWVSERLPHFQTVVDEVAFLKAMHTDEFNHAPAQLLVHTGSSRPGRPGIGAWATYGLGSENADLPGYVVLVSGGNNPDGGKNLWGSGFLPSVYQGVQCRSEGEPVLFLDNPDGMSRSLRLRSIEAINQINQAQHETFQDPEMLTRIEQYELAFRMQMSVPDVMDISREPEHVLKQYGADPSKASFANNCVLARRLAEKGVRFIQLFHWGWDSHGNGLKESLHHGFVGQCQDVDQPMTALIRDLKQRGMLEDTLIVWGGEFGRTPMWENRGGYIAPYKGRDHHSEAFTVWLAGGGIKGGVSHGETDEIGYYGVKDRTHVHDLQATILQCLGFDHEQLTYPFQGRNFRLTDVHGKVIREILA
ncbi:MAG: DUF1501 domain-containing protein [Bacteroidia bacterium]|jgi:hypothetical protein|nr:DUF1501 domain-containing protein [Bacteroidia bacterium]